MRLRRGGLSSVVSLVVRVLQVRVLQGRVQVVVEEEEEQAHRPRAIRADMDMNTDTGDSSLLPQDTITSPVHLPLSVPHTSATEDTEQEEG